MSLNGTYRINNIVFPMPNTKWDEQIIGAGLNGIPVLGTYRLHTWNWPYILPDYVKLFFDLYTTNAILNVLETDSYYASGATQTYGTVEYDDFIIANVPVITRGLPFFDDFTIVFEVAV